MPQTLIEPADPNPRELVEEEGAEESAQSEAEESESKEQEEPSKKEEPKQGESSEGDDDGFKQFLKENELPESFETPEDFAKAYKEVLRQFKTEQTDRGRERPYEAPPKEQPSERKSYFNTKAADALVKTMAESGMFGDNKELETSYKSIAKVIDNAYGSELSKAEQVMETMFATIQKLQDRVLGMEWGAISPEVRKRVQREKIDKLMQEHRFSDYESAVKFYAMAQDPAIFKLLTQRAQENPQGNQNKNKQRVRWGARGGGQPTYDSQEWRGYVKPNGEVDNAKLSALPKAKGDKILDEIIRQLSPRK